MAKFRHIRNSFLGGQVSPTAVGRTDHALYNHSCELIQNMIPMPTGGAYRRPGSLYVAEYNTYNASFVPSRYSPLRAIPFIVSQDEGYALFLYRTSTSATGGLIDFKRVTSNLTGGVSGGTVSGYHPWLYSTTTTNAGVSEVTTYTISEALEAGQTLHITINGTAYSRTFASSSDATMANFATDIAGSPLVQTSVLTVNGGADNDFVITITGKPGINLNITGVTATGGGSLPTVTLVTSVLADTSSGAEDELFAVQYAQSADMMFLVHPKRKPQIISRLGKDNFKIQDFDGGIVGGGYKISSPGSVTTTNVNKANAYPYLPLNTTATTMTPSATTGTGKTLTASADYFVPQHVGSLFKLNHGGGIGSCVVTGYTSPTLVSIDVLEDFSATTATSSWYESAWSNYRGWPRTVAIFQQRLVFGGTTTQPDSIWFSQTGNYQKMCVLGQTNTTTVPDGVVLVRGAEITVSSGVVVFPDDSSEGDGKSTGPRGIQPFRITLSQNTLDEIQWMTADKELLVGTIANEWLIDSKDQGLGFTVGTSWAAIQSSNGSAHVQAVRIGQESIFVSKAGDEVKSYQYNAQDGSFFVDQIQLMFDQYPKPENSNSTNPGRRKVRQIGWDSSRKIIWVLDTAGNFYGCTRDRNLKLNIWHTHQLGGFDEDVGVGGGEGSGATKLLDPAYSVCDGSVVSFSVVPNPLTKVDDIWLVVKRTRVETVTSATISFWTVERMFGRSTVGDSAYDGIMPGVNISEPLLIDCAHVEYDDGSAGDLTYAVGANKDTKSLTGIYYSGTKGLFKITTGAAAASSATITSSVPSDYGTATNIVTLGYSFDSILQLTRIEAGSQLGTAQGAIKRICRAFVRFYKTMACKVGMAPGGETVSGLETLDFNAFNQDATLSVEFFTGDKEVIVPSTYDTDGYLYIKQDEPFPITVVSVSMEGETFE